MQLLMILHVAIYCPLWLFWPLLGLMYIAPHLVRHIVYMARYRLEEGTFVMLQSETIM